MCFEVLYPYGKRKALTMSYDDGQIFDRKLVEIFNQYGIKGTFHLNSGTLDSEEMVGKEEIAVLYKGHEISCHTVHHPYLTKLPKTTVLYEIIEDRRSLEMLSGTFVRGMSFPFGQYSEEILPILQSAGMEYSRTVQEDHSFGWPENFMQWNPTCHHNNIMEWLEEFQNPPEYLKLPLFYVWGHSFEFHRQDNWSLIEEFCKEVGGDEEVWYATNIEIKDYICAVRKLILDVNQTRIFNPSAQRVWIETAEGVREIEPGQSYVLK